MVCQLPVPHWVNRREIGLQSAVENVVDGYIVLTMGEVLPTFPADFAYYVIYYSSDLNSLFDEPRLIATEPTVSIPPTLLSLDQFIAVRSAQLGVARDISSPNLTLVNDNVFLFASPSELVRPLGTSDTHIVVDSAEGFPATDGYVEVGDEVILYSSIVDGYDGYTGLVIADRDPFGCNTITSHLDGYSVAVFKGFEDNNEIGFKARGSCGLPLPEWANWKQLGVKRVADMGIGTSVEVEWFEAKEPPGFSQIYYNVYQARSLVDLDFARPIGFSTNLDELNAVIPNVLPGISYYYRVRAAYQLTNLQTFGFNELSNQFFEYPSTVTLNEPDGYWFEDETGTMTVSSTSGYPNEGFLYMGAEVLQYNSRTATTFNIINRDSFAMGLVEDYPNGTRIDFFPGVSDANRSFYFVVPTWEAGTGTQLPFPDGYNGIPADGYDGRTYYQDEDGYRAIPDDGDLNTEDHSDFEEDNQDFPEYDFCGYRSPNFVNLYSGAQCGTYSGGRRFTTIPGVNNGQPVQVAGGINVTQSVLNREELQLGLTGEVMILLRRKWTGRKCAGLSFRTEHPKARCSICYGTTFEGGYDRYINPREIRPGEANPNGFIAVRVEPYKNDLELTSDRGLDQPDQLTAWTSAIPTIKDRDILIRYVLDQDQGVYVQDFRYEVLYVNRNKLLFGQDGRQQITMKKLAKTREVYKFPIGGPSLAVLPV